MIEVEKKGKKIIITCDIPDKLLPSKSGKTMLVVSTGGFVPAEIEVKGEPCKIALNITVPRK